MRSTLFTAGLICALSVAVAQEKPKAVDLTAEQIIEKSIEATGGRKAMEKLTSTSAKGTMEMLAQGMKSDLEFFAKAPNKRMFRMNMEGFGEIKQGCDGTIAWTSNPMQGVTELTGDAAANAKREAVFQGTLQWKELYTKAELKGKEKFGEHDSYVIVMTPKQGKPITNYYDASSFLLIGMTMSAETPQGTMDVKSEMSDYRDIGDGVKAPFQVKQTMPMGDILLKFTEMKNNVPLEDAMFAKPAK